MACKPEELHSLLRLDLYEAGWEDQGFYPGISKRQVAMNALDASFMKKFHNDVTDETRDDKALQLFLECNKHCQEFDSVKPRTMLEEYIIGEMKSIIYDFFNPCFTARTEEGSFEYRQPLLLNLSDIATHFSLGNGVNIGADETHFYSKLVCSSMAHTDPVLPLLFRQAISVDRLWHDVEVSRAARSGYETVSGSRLSFVPKSHIISRTICTEPVLNMLFQKGIGGVITERLLRCFNVDLSTQPDKNAFLARLGSVTGKYGTIDLSSASDTISIRMLREMLPPEPMNWLMRCRSPKTILPDGTSIELHMISSMGNGYTFPLQTMLFCCLVAAAYRVFSIKLEKGDKQTHSNFAVFGDDIIVDDRVYNAVVDCLEILGFRVNRDKSFNEGTFRESCGSDFYSGYNVRGVYLKRLRFPGDFYSAINRLNRWSSKHGISLPRTVGRLRNGCRFIGVPFDEADDAGIKIPLSLLRNPKNDVNGAIRYLASVNIARKFRIPSVAAEVEFEILEPDIPLPGLSLKIKSRNGQDFHYCSNGLLFCFVAGWIRDGCLGLRSIRPNAVLRKRVCPGWDETAFARGESQESYDRWKAAVTANLVS